VSELRNLALTLADALGVDGLPYLHGEAQPGHVACGVLADIRRALRPCAYSWPVVLPHLEARAAIRAVRDGVDVSGALTALRVLPDGAPRFFDIGTPTGPTAGDVYALAMAVAVGLGVDGLPRLLGVDDDPAALACKLLRETLALVPPTVAPHVRAAVEAAKLPPPAQRMVSLSAILAASEVRR
jgi:hypothetical protein